MSTPTSTSEKLAEELCYACKRGFIDKATELLEKENVKDFIDLKDNEGFNAILWASNGKDAILTLLIEKGAGIEVQDNEGFTPLITASSQDGNVQCVQLLLDAGADVEKTDNMGKNALFHAQSDSEKLKLLEENMPKAKAKHVDVPPPSNSKASPCCVII